MSDPIAVVVARAALMEAGRPDLAVQVERGRDCPIFSGGIPWESRRVVRKAFLLGHLAAGHDDHLIGPRGDGGICCVNSGVPCDHCIPDR